MTTTPRPRALLSVSDKTGLPELARGLAERGFELVSTGGTARAIREAGVPVTDVAEVTAAPEMLDGRVKTLHPRIHGGVLANLHDPSHREQLAEQRIEPFSLVVVNLYPFEQAAARGGLSDDELIEEIDIGGPTLVRAAAKNHANVAIVTDPADYPTVLASIDEHGVIPLATRRTLALKAYRRTAAYDAAIVSELSSRWTPDDTTPEVVPLALRRSLELRYGENPHQAAALYSIVGADPVAGPFVDGADPLQGKPLSYNNLLDASAAAAVARDLTRRGRGHRQARQSLWRGRGGRPRACLGARARGGPGERLRRRRGRARRGRTRPLRSGSRASSSRSWWRSVSTTRRARSSRPSPTCACWRTRRSPRRRRSTLEARAAGGGVLLMTSDVLPDDPAPWRTVSGREPTEAEWADLTFAWRIARHVKSNAIVLARDGAVVGVGAGQMNRVQSARLAVEQAGEKARGAVCASDAFFPFPDGVETCLAAGVTAVVEPGGSRSDAAVIEAVDAAGAAMVFTGRRHFRH